MSQSLSKGKIIKQKNEKAKLIDDQTKPIRKQN